ncbi:MAG: DHH family phosphoesterase, partial [Defluviitaleaceae bacterium]|nr:DHH family phosphoesterase [Defluviitaleaceae bacterium]
MEQIVELLRSRDRFVIAGHIGPDGDTIGSCLGLAMALRKLGKDAVVVLETTAAKYRVIPGQEYLYKGPLEALFVDVFIAMDCADTQRLGAARQLFDRAATTICIDHHETNSGFAQYNLIDPDASSTAEMVFGVIEALTDIDIDIATAIYSGIVGDTGGFRYSSTSGSTMAIAARLMAMGISFTDIYSEMLLSHSFEAAKAFGLALGAAGQALGGRIVYTYVTREMLASVDAESSDMDSVVEYLMNTRGAEVALFLYERHSKNKDECEDDITSSDTGGLQPSIEPRKIKVSMRS